MPAIDRWCPACFTGRVRKLLEPHLGRQPGSALPEHLRYRSAEPETVSYDGD